MAENKIKSGINPMRVLLGILGFIVILVVAYLSWQYAIKPALAAVPTWGSETTSEAVNAPEWLQSMFGAEVFQSWNALVVFIAVFIILLLALADILNAFSTFSEGTSWGIALALGVIGVMTGVVNKAIVYIFGGAAAFGALGIAIIIIWAVVVAVAMNIVIGWSGIKAMREAKLDQAKVNTVASNLKKGYGVFKAGAEIADSENPK